MRLKITKRLRQQLLQKAIAHGFAAVPQAEFLTKREMRDGIRNMLEFIGDGRLGLVEPASQEGA